MAARARMRVSHRQRWPIDATRSARRRGSGRATLGDGSTRDAIDCDEVGTLVSCRSPLRMDFSELSIPPRQLRKCIISHSTTAITRDTRLVECDGGTACARRRTCDRKRINSFDEDTTRRSRVKHVSERRARDLGKKRAAKTVCGGGETILRCDGPGSGDGEVFPRRG